MKIVMVISGMCSGGAERVMATLCNELSKKHEVLLLSLRREDSDYKLSERVIFKKGNFERNNLLKAVCFVHREMREWKPDVMLSFMVKANVTTLVAKLLSGMRTPVIIAERANPYYAPLVFKILKRMWYPFADGAVFQTEQARDYYKGIMKCKTAVLRNPLNPDFVIVPYEGERKKKIVTAGRLSEEKNQKLLIDAFSRIAEKYPEYSVEIYGDGPLRETLDQYISVIGMQDRIKLMGRKNHIENHIKDVEIFVLPSNSEGMPNALLEAAALGLACIATDCPIGGSAVIIKDGYNGLLIPMNDVSALEKALCRVLDSEDLAQTLRSRAVDVVKDFDTKSVCAQWEQYLKTFEKI